MRYAWFSRLEMASIGTFSMDIKLMSGLEETIRQKLLLEPSPGIGWKFGFSDERPVSLKNSTINFLI